MIILTLISPLHPLTKNPSFKFMKKILFIIFLSSLTAFADNPPQPTSSIPAPVPGINTSPIPTAPAVISPAAPYSAVSSPAAPSTTDSKTIDLKGMDPKSLEIPPPLKDSKEWRSSTVYKVMDLCIKLGTSPEKCSCNTDHGRSKYQESVYLKLRSELIDIVINKKDISGASPELKLLLDSTYTACNNS